MKHAVPHGLDLPMAKKVAVAALEAYSARLAEYSPNVDWSSETHANVRFSVKGITLKGAVDVNSRSIELDLDVPFVLRVFKKKAIAVIEREIKIWLEKARNGELD